MSKSLEIDEFVEGAHNIVLFEDHFNEYFEENSLVFEGEIQQEDTGIKVFGLVDFSESDYLYKHQLIKKIRNMLKRYDE